MDTFEKKQNLKSLIYYLSTQSQLKNIIILINLNFIVLILRSSSEEGSDLRKQGVGGLELVDLLLHVWVGQVLRRVVEELRRGRH
jgi:hypothetical protein